MNYYTDEAFKVGISDLKHTKCKTSLIMDKDEDRAAPYCPKCKKFIYDRGKIRLNKNPESRRKIISMILLMGAIEFRVEHNKEMMRKKNEHRLQVKSTKGA